MELEKILWKFRRVILGIACLMVLMSGGSETASAEYTHVFHVSAIRGNLILDKPRDVYIDFKNIMSVDGHDTDGSVWTRYIVPVMEDTEFENGVHRKYVFVHSDYRDRTVWFCYYTDSGWANNTWYYYTAEDWAGKTMSDMDEYANGLAANQPVDISAHSDDFMFNYDELDTARHLYAGILYKTLQFSRGMINGSEPLMNWDDYGRLL